MLASVVELVTEALIGLPDRVVDPRHELHDVVTVADCGLDHGEFVAAEPRDQVGRLDAILDAGRDRLQQFVADMMPERVVDALEFVDVDIEQRELLAADGLLELALDLFAEQHPVRQVGQRVVMREMRDLLVGAPALGDVVDDVDDVTGLARGIANPDAPGGDVAAAHRLAFPEVLVLEQRRRRIAAFCRRRP